MGESYKERWARERSQKRLLDQRKMKAEFASLQRYKAWVWLMKDAEHECKHGKIRGYLHEPDPCGCWPDDVTKALFRKVQGNHQGDFSDAA